MHRTFVVLSFVFGLSSTACAHPNGQLHEPATFEVGRVYRLDYTLASASGGAKPTTYALSVEEGRPAGLRLGDNVALGGSTRIDTGLRVSCHYAMQGESLVLHSDVEWSALGNEQTVHKVTASSDSLLTPGAATLVAMIEDPATHAHYDVNVSATRVR